MMFEVFQESFPSRLENSFARNKINLKIHNFYFTFYNNLAFKKHFGKTDNLLIACVLNEQE